MNLDNLSKACIILKVANKLVNNSKVNIKYLKLFCALWSL